MMGILLVFETFNVIASRAVEPLFYNAPVPPDMPHGIEAKQYQHACVEFCLAREHALIGDAPGLGKTAEAIMLGNAIEAEYTLVVCFAPNTRVLTTYGWKRIVEVNRDDLLWDGGQWVKHSGLVYRGQKQTIDLAGVSVTPDHTLLSGQKWVAASVLAQNSSKLKLALERGMENLPSWALQEGREVEFTKRWYNAIVELKPMRYILKGFIGDVLSSALSVRVHKQKMQPALCMGTQPLSQIVSKVGDYIGASITVCSDAITPRIKVSTAMGGEVFTYGRDGERDNPVVESVGKAVAHGWHILSHYLIGISLAWSWTVSTWIKGMSRVIFAGLLGYKMREIVGHFKTFRHELVSLKPVYDLVNAGPNQRFTILSDRGPLIAHNCPASLRLNWEREIWLWSTIHNVQTYPVLKASDGVSLQANYTIVSYDMLRNENIMDAIMDGIWDHLILDEAHYLKDPKGNKRTRAICAPDMLPSVVDRITALSGTILPNQPIECYNICRLLDWEALDCMSLETFRQTYYEEGGGMIRSPVFDKERQAWINKLHWSDTVRNVPCNLADLQFRLRDNLMIRRLKEQVLHELPPKQWHLFPLTPTAAMRKALKHPGWKQAEKLYDLDPDAFNRSIPIDGAVSTARRELGEAKAPAVADYINDLLDSGISKLVVAAWHHTVLDYLRERLEKYGLVYMDGNTTPLKKQQAVDTFQSDDKIKIILGQMLPLGEGWTLTAAQDVVFCEPDWVPGKNDQLLDRVHRIGQEGNHIIGHVPVVPDTLDERILGTAIAKDINIFATLDKR